MSKVIDIALIGPGKVGTSICVLAAKSGYRVTAIGGRNLDKAQRSAKLIGGNPKTCSPLDAARSAGLILLAVSDGAIQPVCKELAKQNAFSSEQIVAHLSGALSSEALSSARNLCGVKTGSFHPLQMFPTVEAALAAMPGSHWFCEGEREALEVLEELVRKIGGHPHTITAANKALYHCSSVIACNYLNALMDIALTVAEQAGLERKTAWEALLPLIRATIANIDKLGTADSLTGPIERGDVQTVADHLHALGNNNPEITDIYKILGDWTIRLAHEKGSLKPEDESKLRKELGKHR